MIRRTIATIWFALLFVSLFGISVKLTDEGRCIDSEGLTACLVLWTPTVATALVVAFAIATRRIWHLLKWTGIGAPHAAILAEDEHHGRMDLD